MAEVSSIEGINLFKDHLDSLMKRDNIQSINKLASEAGVRQQTLNYQYLNGRPTVEVLVPLSHYFNVPIDYFVSGKTYSDFSSGETKDLPAQVITVVETVDNSGKPNIPLVKTQARAGYRNNLDQIEYYSNLPTFSVPGFRDATFRAFEVAGYSMLSEEGLGLYPTDIVICTLVASPNQIIDDRVYVIVTYDDVLIKRCLNRIKTGDNKIICNSDNESGDYPQIPLEQEDIREVWEFKAKISRHIPKPTKMREDVNNLRGQVALMYSEIQELRDLLA